jgi:hypothetical protein
MNECARLAGKLIDQWINALLLQQYRLPRGARRLVQPQQLDPSISAP